MDSRHLVRSRLTEVAGHHLDHSKLAVRDPPVGGTDGSRVLDVLDLLLVRGGLGVLDLAKLTHLVKHDTMHANACAVRIAEGEKLAVAR